jgi:hypothetical protein
VVKEDDEKAEITLIASNLASLFIIFYKIINLNHFES